ncbi:MAG: zinc ribbon domain-containing protein, partial [Rubripirellula sp.]|nr:zinc ribbon domain-containing protein [Rubripirellula sp.]
DFGLARFESGDRGHGDRGQTKAGAVLGTLDFMPPEQHRDASRADARSDQWALAASVYQMVTGESPRVIRPDRLPESMRAAVLRALEENPEKRFADCRAFRDALLQSQVSAENSVRRLTPGQCGNCQHINDVKKTFCEACGENLLQPCPGCNEKVGVWVTFCGECGADLAKELDAKRIALFQQQKDIESLRRRYRHADAIEQLEEIIGLDHPAFETHRTWASQKLSEYRAEFSGLEKQRDEILALVRERIQTHDLDGALPLLDRVPEPLANSEVAALRKELSVRIEEIQSLGKQIRLAVASKQLEGLISKVEKFLDLRPSDEKAKKLLSQLRKRAAKQATHTAALAAAHDTEDPVSDRSTPDPGIVLLNDASSKREFPNLGTVVADSHAMARPVNTHKLSQQRKTRRLQGILVGSVFLVVLLLVGIQWLGDRSTSDDGDLRSAGISTSSGQQAPTDSALFNPSTGVDERDQVSSSAVSSDETGSSDDADSGDGTANAAITTSGTPASVVASEGTVGSPGTEPRTSTGATETANPESTQTGRPAQSPENENDRISVGTTASPVDKNLAGTTWNVSDSNGDKYVFYFQVNGILHYEAGRGLRENASWKWLGPKLTIRINNDFAHFSGMVEGGNVTGSGFSKNGAEWSWTASRIAQ